MASANLALSRLLRNTRLSTYDPAVRQVYQTPKAHAVRGDWGLKRPLPSSWQTSADARAQVPYPGALRYATIENMDNAQGLTDWSEAEREPLFRVRWHEAGVRLADRARRDVLGVSMLGDDDVNQALGPRPRIAYDPATCADAQKLPTNVVWGAHHERFQDRPDVLPNYHAMDERTFQRFLAQLRRQRGKFRKALQAQREQATVAAQMDELAQAAAQRPVSEAEWQNAQTPRDVPAIDMWTEARLPPAPRSAAHFLEAQAHARFEAPQSHALTAPAHAAPAHPLRGLQYAQPDSVYTYLLNEPLHGRALHRVEDARRQRYFMGSDAALAVALGGHVGHLPLQHRHGLDMVDYTRAQPQRGESYFRVLHAWLDMAPTVANARRAPPRPDVDPALGSVRMQVMALRRPGGRGEYVSPPLPGSPRWIDEPPAAEVSRALRATSPEAGSLFGSLARHSRATPGPRANPKRQRLQKRQRDLPGSVQRDIQMLNNIKNLLSPP
ncbi:hypothetical protein MEQU1_001582 [Malassezia equina]|uniref:Uncharacterized protein n=1 Tax=Malassezia equina TaxID=1381935 RepID=A0AAF0ECA5_9BASI|nr:hypothetical protein MEQU1_001582 [Malassezia equina]